jgi:predicted nucleotidyltransferase component of viral defense system
MSRASHSRAGRRLILFVLDLPRLSVDIDLTYLPAEPRDQALAGIDAALRRIQGKLERESRPYAVAAGRTDSRGRIDTSNVTADGVEVKIEVNPVLRQALNPARTLSVQPRVEAQLGFARIQVLSHEDLFAGKMVAALDRQHPRDLFDIRELLRGWNLDSSLIRTFLMYVAGHKGVMAHLLNPRPKDIEALYRGEFQGMIAYDVPLAELRQSWEQFVRELRSRLGDKERRFLLSVKRRAPEWELVGLPDAADWPAIRWKLQNLEHMDADAHRKAVAELEQALAGAGS